MDLKGAGLCDYVTILSCLVPDRRTRWSATDFVNGARRTDQTPTERNPIGHAGHPSRLVLKHVLVNVAVVAALMFPIFRV